MTRAPKTTLLLVLAAGAACRSPGPTLTVRNPGKDRVFVDGRLVLDGDAPATLNEEAGENPLAADERELAFRYYGATRWDVLPNVSEDGGVPVFDRGPQSVAVELPPPASPWLFPLDFVLEVTDRLFYGPRDVTVTATATEREPLQGTIPQQALGELSTRARAARSAR